MFQISVEREFCAAHALMIRGAREPVHGHNFRLTVTVEGDTLDADGLLVDFHALERLIDEIIRPWQNADLGAAAAFARGPVNPSAENIAWAVGDRVSAGLASAGVAARLASVRVTEAPGCTATYIPTTYPDPRSNR